MGYYYIEKEYKLKLGFYIEARNNIHAKNKAILKCAELNANLHNKIHEIKGLSKYETSCNSDYIIKEAGKE